MNDLIFPTEEEEQTARASDPRNFALCAAHVNAVYKSNFSEWFIRVLSLRQTRRARARWEEELPDRQKWRLNFYLGELKYQRKLQSEIAKNPDFKTKAEKRADRARAKAFKICAANGVACENWSEESARRIVADKHREKLRRDVARLFPDHAR